jgi:hypothetical protein
LFVGLMERGRPEQVVASTFDPQWMFDCPDPYPIVAEMRRNRGVAPDQG